MKYYVVTESWETLVPLGAMFTTEDSEPFPDLGRCDIALVSECDWYLLKLIPKRFFEAWVDGKKLKISPDYKKLYLIGGIAGGKLLNEHIDVDILDFVKHKINKGENFEIEQESEKNLRIKWDDSDIIKAYIQMKASDESWKIKED